MIIALMAAALALQESKPDEKRVKELVELLDADDPAARGKAEAELAAMGEGVELLLEKLRPSAGAEARARIDNVVTQVTMARRWVKELMEEDPGGAAFRRLQEALAGKTLDRQNACRILTLVLLNEASPEGLKQYMYTIADRHKLRELWPALVHLAARDERDASYAVSYLKRLNPPAEAADEILKILPKITNSSMGMQLLEVVITLKPDKQKLDKALQAILDAEGEEYKSSIMSYISQGRLRVPLKTALRVWRSGRPTRATYSREAVLKTPPDEAVSEILEGIGSAEADEALLCVDYVAKYKLAQAAVPMVEALHKQASDERPFAASPLLYASPPGYGRYLPEDRQLRPRLVSALRALATETQVREWLASSGRPPRAAVIGLVGELELRGLTGEVVKALGDGDPAVRREAARALASLRPAEGAPALEALLKDDNLAVRRTVLHALARIRGSAATPLVLAQLKSDDADMQAAAMEVLPSMDADALLDEFCAPLNLTKPIMRQGLAVLVVYHGEAMLHRVLSRTAGRLSADDLGAMVKLIQSVRTYR